MPAARRPATRRRTAATGEAPSRTYHDVVLKGTFEVRMTKLRATTAERAKSSAKNELEEYAKEACQGDNTVEITSIESKPYKRKVMMELKIEESDVEKAKELIATLGEKVTVRDAYMEREGRY